MTIVVIHPLTLNSFKFYIYLGLLTTFQGASFSNRELRNSEKLNKLLKVTV